VIIMAMSEEQVFNVLKFDRTWKKAKA